MPNVTTPVGTLSYPAIWEAKTTPSGEEKYGCALIFPEGTDLSALKAAAMAAAQERWGTKAQQMLKTRQLRMPFRDGAEKAQAGYGEATTFVNVTSYRQPGMVSRYAGPDGKPLAITDPEEIYPGCKVRASLYPHAYETSGNKGVTFFLNAIQKIGDGPRLDGRLRAEDTFEAFESTPADFDAATDDPMAA
jgi:hypothetical protein